MDVAATAHVPFSSLISAPATVAIRSQHADFSCLQLVNHKTIRLLSVMTSGTTPSLNLRFRHSGTFIQSAPPAYQRF
jgi:hypothetical protein